MNEGCSWTMMENAEANTTEVINIKELAVEVNELLQVKMPGDKATHYSRVNDALDSAIVVAWPTSRGIRMPLRPEQVAEFSFVRNGVPYGFTGLIQGTNLGPPPQVTVQRNSDIKKIQRRQNFRIKCFMPVEITGCISKETTESGERQSQGLYIKTTTYDLSAGGLSIRHTIHIPEESIIEVKLGLPDGGPEIRTPGRITYAERTPGNGSLYQMGIDCFAATESERARIIRCLYRIQLRSLKP
jgi:c-di-GMP-binding flagellar brake protein YcgR